MAHFAELDANNVVLRVIVVGNQDLLDENGVEREHIGVAFCKSLFGADTIWKQTSYNNNLRKRYAGIGFTYNPELDAFVRPKTKPTWVLDPETADWVPPIPKPSDGIFVWNEKRQEWHPIDPDASANT